MPNQPLDFDDEQLRTRARTLIASGTLPVVVSVQLNAGYGTGARCAVCALAIGPETVEYETSDPRNGLPLNVHMRCHQAWQLACLPARARPGGDEPVCCGLQSGTR